ncbi:MAG: 4-(cytidine 5'-diphospho)-2-C-methyl-D-erythritol kinase [Aquificaceae bacterium]|nr:MAG: 4-(cytidine 5'-diphospho)-2-C-methyl-D-erythritol kinase [Aquificaceae bacterium]
MDFTLTSCGKINWGLWLLGKRKDHYHEIFTPIQKISLCDLIRIKPSRELRVETTADIPQEENLVYKGLKLFEEITGLKPLFEVFIEKKIPIGGGLGGGSSNLATVLNFVNNYFGNPLNREELLNLLASVSSDAPSFLCNGVAIATGRGEKIECLNLPRFRGIEVTLFVPNGISSPTGKIYSKTHPSMFNPKEKVDLLREKIKKLSPEEFFQIAENPLGGIFLDLHPTVKEDIDFLQKVCYKKFIVSGSGSSFYTVGSLKGDCLKALDKLKGSYKIISLVAL